MRNYEITIFTAVPARRGRFTAWLKGTDSRAKSWGGSDQSVELDAIQPDRLRRLVRSCIEQHRPRDEFDRLKEIEAAERQSLLAFLDGRGEPS